MYPPEYFSYDPDTGDLRWAMSPANTVNVGDPVGYFNSKNDLRCCIKGRSVKVLHLAHWLHYGTWRENIEPANGDWSDLRAANIAPARKTKRRVAKIDHFNVAGGESYAGPHRLSAIRAKLLLKIAAARRYDRQNQCWVRRPVTYDELIEILWPDPDNAPLCARNNISVHVCQINKRLKGWRIVSLGYNKGFTLKEVKP